MAQAKLGVQLIVFGGRPGEDLAGVLRDVRAAGYAGIEAGNLFQIAPCQGCAMSALEETGLAVAGMHTGYGDMADPAKVDANIEYLQAVGGKYLICSGVKDNESLQGYIESGETFNTVGRRCREAGLAFAYHNHAWEFKEFGGQKGIHALIAATDPELVKLCIDVYWVHIGGEAPAEFIERYHDRAGYYHFKDGSPGKFIELGQGEVDLVAAKEAALKYDADWIVCEQDRSDLDPAESVKISYEYLKGIGL
jgi:sugar phosphate isomerase/epimerase